jgi:hypothetical protein
MVVHIFLVVNSEWVVLVTLMIILGLVAFVPRPYVL